MKDKEGESANRESVLLLCALCCVVICVSLVQNELGDALFIERVEWYSETGSRP